MLSFCNELPEFNHNVIVGGENNTSIIEKLSIVWLNDESNHERI